MNRHIVYPGQIPLETDLLNVAKDAYVGLAKLAEAIVGTTPVLAGFAVTPTSPASMSVQIAAGQIYSQQVLDQTDYSSLGEDSTPVVKQGLKITSTTTASGTFTAPYGAGESINYLVQVGYLGEDADAIVLPYYNSATPNMAWTGPSGSGSSQATIRSDLAVVSVLTGTAAPTGTQTTPGPSAGCVGAYVVTVANGQSSITSGNIAVYSNASFIGNQPAGFSLNSVAPLASPALSGNPTAPTQAFSDSSTKLATTAFARNLMGNYDAVTAIGTTTATLTAAMLGNAVQYNGAAPGSFTLPALTTLPTGGAYQIYNQSQYPLTVQVNGSVDGATDFIWHTAAVSSIVLQPGDDIILVARGTNEIDVMGGTGAIQFAQTHAVTQSAGDSSTRLATTAYADRAAQEQANGAYAADTGSTNSLTIALTPAPANVAVLTGLALRVKVANAVTGTCSLNVNGLGASSIVHGDGSNISSGEIPAGALITVVYDGTRFQLQSVSYQPAPANILQSIYPVGCVYLSTSSTNPASTFGFGTWAQIAAGRALVGVGIGTDANGNTLTVAEGNDAGQGEYLHKLTTTEMPSHAHAYYAMENAGSGFAAGPGSNFSVQSQNSANTGGDGYHNNVQPYFGVFVWSRTA